MKEITGPAIRPSTSGKTTFMARSAAESPRVPLSQAVRKVAAVTTWTTGQSAAAKGAAPSPAPALNAVALRITSGLSRATASASAPAAAGSFSEVTEIGTATRPRAPSAAVSASIGAVSAARRSER